jgi:predicted O-methyltransferase YrrM
MSEQLSPKRHANWGNHWKTVYRYFKDQGIPSGILKNYCINPAEAAQISSIIKKTHPRTILEVGTFIGLSTGVIALARAPESTFVCIDPNLPVGFYVNFYTPEVNSAEKGGSLVFVRQMLKHFGQDKSTIVLEGFFSHLSAWAREQITTLGGDPEQAVIIGERIGEYAPYDLAFIDGDHHADSVYSDLSLIHPYLAQNGIIVLHDVSGGWEEEVCAGIAQFIQAHPEFSLKTDYRLGFLSRDVEKAWFGRQKPPSLVKRMKWRMVSLVKG